MFANIYTLGHKPSRPSVGVCAKLDVSPTHVNTPCQVTAVCGGGTEMTEHREPYPRWRIGDGDAGGGSEFWPNFAKNHQERWKVFFLYPLFFICYWCQSEFAWRMVTRCSISVGASHQVKPWRLRRLINGAKKKNIANGRKHYARRQQTICNR